MSLGAKTVLPGRKKASKNVEFEKSRYRKAIGVGEDEDEPEGVDHVGKFPQSASCSLAF